MTTTSKPSQSRPFASHFYRKVQGALDTASVMHCNGNVMLYVQMTHADNGAGAHLTVTEARTLAAHLIAAADALAPVCRLAAVQHKHSLAHVLIDAEGTCLVDLPDDWSEAWDAADAWATANGYRFDYAAGTVSLPEGRQAWPCTSWANRERQGLSSRYVGDAWRASLGLPTVAQQDAEADRLA
jgi:hypothetical protein